MTDLSDRPIAFEREAGELREPKRAEETQRRPALLSPALLVRLAILLVAAGIVLLFTEQWPAWTGGLARQTTDDAYVRGDITPLSAKVEGLVRAVPVRDFQRVRAGDLLVQIVDDDYRARVDQAQAEVLGAEAAIANLEARKAQQQRLVEEAQAQIAATEADVERTGLEARRQKALLRSTYGTAQRVEVANADEKRFRAQLARNQANLEAERAQQVVLDTEASQLRAALRAKQAALELARITLGYTRIVAPVDGMVNERQAREGQYVHPGTEIISVVPLQNVWVVANYKETQLTHVAIGDRAEIAVDTFPGETIAGQVVGIAPASGSQFSLLPPDNATGNFTKVVQRIPVKIALDPDNPLAGRLRPGMSVIATILTDTHAGAAATPSETKP